MVIAWRAVRKNSFDKLFNYLNNRFAIYVFLHSVGKVVEAKEAKAAYNEAKRVAKRVVWLAKSEDERGVFADISPTGDYYYYYYYYKRKD